MPATRPNRPYAFAHRGGDDGGHPDNSLAALGDALRRGCDLESDVRLSVDRVPVLVHDRIGLRGWRPVWPEATPVALLRRMRVATLADLYERLGTDFELSLDLKSPGAWRATLAVARRAGAVRRLWLVHDDLELLRTIRAADPDVRLVHEARTGWLDAPSEPGRRAGHPSVLAASSIDAQNTTAPWWTADDLERARAAGVLAFGSLLQTPEELRSAAAKGLDALYSDRLEDMLAAIRGPASTAAVRAIDAVLFDFGHTLFTHAPGPDVVRCEAAALGIGLTPEEATAVWAEIDAAAMAPEERARGRDLDPAVWAARWSVLYGLADRIVPGLGAAIDRSFHDPLAWEPYADTESTLRALAGAGIAVGVVSNTGWDIRGPFTARGLDRWVRSFTTSYEAGAVKPDPAIFHAACASLGVEPARVWMVGDDPEADAGATAAGLAGVTLVDATRPIDDPRGLAEVLDRALRPTGP